jgi:two-component system sensor histidine kinase DevS
MARDGSNIPTAPNGEAAQYDGRPLSDTGLNDDAAWRLLDAAPDGIFLIDATGYIQLVNRQAEEMFGFNRSELLGRPVEDLLPEQFQLAHRAHRTRYAAEPRIRAMGADLQLKGRRADGSEFPVEISLSPLPTDSGLRIVAAVRDITERVAAEAEAREIRNALDATRDGVAILDADTLRFIYVNDGTLEQVGYRREQLLEMTMLHLTPELDAPHLRALLAPMEAGETRSTVFTTVHRRQDGVDVPVEILMQAIVGADGRPRRYVKIVRDITARLDAEQQLRLAEQEVRLLEDRERIARDLHDIVVQKLFAAGMSLQAVASRTPEPESARRISKVIDDLDMTIREIRSAIFSLQSDPNTREGVRSEILRITEEERLALGFDPRVHFSGAIETMPADIAAAVFATVREALSNVARHSHATTVEIFVDVGDEISVRVLDNGIGVPPDVVGGNGLRNVTERARLLGGRCTVQRRDVGGTEINWIVSPPA